MTEIESVELTVGCESVEVDPFASETESQISERDCADVDDIEGEDNSEENSDCSLQIITVHVPLVSKDVTRIQIVFPYTTTTLFEALKEEQPAVFDSKGNFNGNVYGIDGRLLFVNNDREETEEIVLIHRLESAAGIMDEESVVKDSKVSSVSSEVKTKSLMSRFKNLWNKRTTQSTDQSSTSSSSSSLTSESSVFAKDLDKFPEFITDVLDYLRRDEQVQEGLFRLSGTFTRIQSLKERLDAGEALSQMALTATDCHNVTSLLKQFLRNLPQPLLTFELYEAWQTLGTWTAHPAVSTKIARFLIAKLPEVNKKMLSDLASFLNDRLKDSEVTRMNACNYGTVIGPNLLWHPQEERHTKHSTTLGLSLQSTTLASQIFTLMLQNYEEIFGGVEASDEEEVVAYGRVVYDYTCEDDVCEDIETGPSASEDDAKCDTPPCDTCDTTPCDTVTLKDTPSPTGFTENELIFITAIDDSPDGWWLGYLHPSAKATKFPSNYLKILSQCDDEAILNRTRLRLTE